MKGCESQVAEDTGTVLAFAENAPYYDMSANQFLRYSAEKPNISNDDYRMPICLAQLGHDSPICATGATMTNTA